MSLKLNFLAMKRSLYSPKKNLKAQVEASDVRLICLFIGKDICSITSICVSEVKIGQMSCRMASGITEKLLIFDTNRLDVKQLHVIN